MLGERDFWEHMGGVDIYLAPSSFGQANTQVSLASLKLECELCYKYLLLNKQKY